VQIVRQLARVQRRLHCHHAAADIHADRGRYDRAFGWNHASYSGANPPMDIRHRRHPLVDKRHRSNVAQLFLRHSFDGNTFGPGFDGCALFRLDNIVIAVAHRLFSLARCSAACRRPPATLTSIPENYSPANELRITGLISFLYDLNNHCPVSRHEDSLGDLAHSSS
jgi:hypothetical protein